MWSLFDTEFDLFLNIKLNIICYNISYNIPFFDTVSGDKDIIPMFIIKIKPLYVIFKYAFIMNTT